MRQCFPIQAPLLRGKGRGFFSRGAERGALVTMVFKWSAPEEVQKHRQPSQCEENERTWIMPALPLSEHPLGIVGK